MIYKIEAINEENFLKLPQWIFNGKYKDALNPTDKIVYCFLRRRYELSASNLEEWADEAGRIYFKYSEEKLAEDIGVSARTVMRSIKKLIDLNLLNIYGKDYTNANIYSLEEPEKEIDDTNKKSKKLKFTLFNKENKKDCKSSLFFNDEGDNNSAADVTDQDSSCEKMSQSSLPNCSYNYNNITRLNNKNNNLTTGTDKISDRNSSKNKNILHNAVVSCSDEINNLMDLMKDHKLSYAVCRKIYEAGRHNTEYIKKIYEYFKDRKSYNFAGLMIAMVKPGAFTFPEKTKFKNKFNNFKPRDYDYDKLEMALLGYADYSIDECHMDSDVGELKV